MATALTQYTQLWTRLQPKQRIAVVVAALATLGLVIALVFYGSQPEYGVLFSDLKPADAQTIVEKLKAGNVAYKVSAGGTTVNVPSDRIAELRLQMASSGALSGGHVGFDLFDKTSFGATDFTQQVNYQRALEGELAKTLEAMDEFESARVHITQARESIFADKADRAKASVVVRVRQGHDLSRERTEAILNLVASAIEGLDPGDISVMDARGRLLSAPSRNGTGAAGDANTFNSHLEARRSFETETAARVVSLLEPITGVGHVRADVSADLDFNRVEQTEEKYDPKSAVIRSQQSAQETRNSQAVTAAGIAGVRSNDPTRTPSPTPTPVAVSSGDGRTATTTNYEIDKTVTHTVGNGGRITRLSVSVVADYKNVNGVATIRSPEELQKMQGLVAAAVGIDSAKMDQVVVQSIPFDQPTIEVKAPSWQDKNRELIQVGLKYGLLALAALLVIIFIIRPARKHLRMVTPLELPQGEARTERRVLTAGQPVAVELHRSDSPDADTSAKTVAELQAQMDAEVAREMASFIPEVKRASAVRRQLVEHSTLTPETLAMTVRGWLQENRK
jgi:flagellar M-ring protein FliF